MKKWVEAIKRKNFIPSQHSRICSVHFTSNDYQIRPDASRPVLRLNAFPSVFPSFPSYYQTPVNKNPRKNPTIRTPIQTNNIIDGRYLKLELYYYLLPLYYLLLFYFTKNTIF